MENRTKGTYLAFCCDHWELLPHHSVFPVLFPYSGWSKQTNKEIDNKFEFCTVTFISTWKEAKLCTLGGPKMTGTLWSALFYHPS